MDGGGDGCDGCSYGLQVFRVGTPLEIGFNYQ